ncbi:hypothetical protein [Burkholderia sp. lig30]|jgi:hypothetical protein|uniref:hypothetical protein n=1 Tax=Burkholderia sp. lig30 TaxID=1192124 RepID=UPI00128FCBD4|nr:hypothetical protein [Burkholderia sp. lig30]
MTPPESDIKPTRVTGGGPNKDTRPTRRPYSPIEIAASVRRAVSLTWAVSIRARGSRNLQRQRMPARPFKRRRASTPRTRNAAHRAMFRMARDRGHCEAGNRATACADNPSGFIATCALHYRDNDENATAI